MLSAEKIEQCESDARNKLENIIRLYGDLNGKRREPWYLLQLITESIVAENLMTETLEVKGKAHRQNP